MLSRWVYDSGNALSFREFSSYLDLSAKSAYPSVGSALSLADLHRAQQKVERTT